MLAISHAATALLVKRRFPDAPMAWILVAVELPAILWVVLNLAGVERAAAYMPYSHSVASQLALALAVWLLMAKLLRRHAMGAAGAVAVFLHLAVDLVLHAHLELAPMLASHRLGLGLYATPPLAIAAAVAYGLLCWLLFRGGKALLAAIMLLSLAQFSVALSPAVAAAHIFGAAALVWYLSRGRAAELEHPDRRLSRAFA